MGWPCDLSVDDYCNDPKCRGGQECQAWLCCPEDIQKPEDNEPTQVEKTVQDRDFMMATCLAWIEEFNE